MTSVLSDSWFPGWPCAVVGPSCQTALSFQTPLPHSGLFSQVKTRWTWSGKGEPGLGRTWFSLFYFIPLWTVWFYDDWHVFFFTIKKETNRFFQNVKWLLAQMDFFCWALILISSCLLDIDPQLLNKHLRVDTYVKINRSKLVFPSQTCFARVNSTSAHPAAWDRNGEASAPSHSPPYPSIQVLWILSTDPVSHWSSSLHPHHHRPGLSCLHHSLDFHISHPGKPLYLQQSEWSFKT